MISNLKKIAGRYLNALRSLFTKQKPPAIPDEFIVNGLPLPPLLISLLQEGKWKHSGDSKMRELTPLLEGVGFCSLSEMGRVTSFTIRHSRDLNMLFRQVVGTKVSTPVELPWLDIEKMVFVALVLDFPDDIGIVLDYRTSLTDPRVVVSDWLSDTDGCYWREVTPTFTEFVERLGLK